MDLESSYYYFDKYTKIQGNTRYKNSYPIIYIKQSFYSCLFEKINYLSSNILLKSQDSFTNNFDYKHNWNKGFILQTIILDGTILC